METHLDVNRSAPRGFLIGMAVVVLAVLSALGGYSLRAAVTGTTGNVAVRAVTRNTTTGTVLGDRWYRDQQAGSTTSAGGDRWYLDQTPPPSIPIHEDNGR